MQSKPAKPGPISASPKSSARNPQPEILNPKAIKIEIMLMMHVSLHQTHVTVTFNVLAIGHVLVGSPSIDSGN